MLYCFQDTSYTATKLTKIWFLTWIAIFFIAFCIALYHIFFIPQLQGLARNIYIRYYSCILCNELFNIIVFIYFKIITINYSVCDVQLAQLDKSISIQIVDTDTVINDQDGQKDQNDQNDIKEELELGLDDTPDNMRNLSLMIRDMSKYTILISVAAVSSFLMCILVIIGSVIDTIRALIIVANFTIIDGIINVICLTLQFYFSKKYYDICCSKLQKTCERRYTKNVNSRLQKSEAAQNSSHILQLKTLYKRGTL